MKILIKNGRVIDPSQGIDKVLDVFIESGKVKKTGERLDMAADETIDASGKIVAPGFIDMHTHLREPGREDKETVETGTRAAVKGGFTTVCAMPNTDPPCDKEAHAGYLLRRAKEAGLSNIIPVGAITKAREGKEITEMRELKDAGCLLVSDDGDTVADTALMRHAMEYASMVDLLVSVHCEDKALAGTGVMHEGYWSTVLGLSPIPSESESVIVERDIQLASLTGARLHIAHVSAAKSVDLIRAAKKKGITVTAEATPHHFTLTDESLKTYDTNYKVNPPLRERSDVDAVIEGLKDGTIDVIATDHAPHTENEKEKELDYAPFGMIGLETALSLAVMNLVDTGKIGWSALVAKLSANPAKILRYDRGTLKESAAADVVIIDPEKKWVYKKEDISSKSFNSPFIGWELKGKVRDVIVGGRIVLKDEKLTR
jgi:dihydroorotase